MPSATIRTDLELEYLFCPGVGQVVPDTSVNLYHGVMGLTDSVEPYGVGIPTDMVVYDPSWVSNGVEFSGASADYNSSVITAPADSVLLTDQWTDISFEVWLNPTSSVGSAIFALGAEALFLSNNDVVFYYHKDAFGRVDFDEINLTGGNLPPLNTWTHWIVTRTANDINWYINGALAQTLSLALDRFGAPHVANSKLALYTRFPHPVPPDPWEPQEHVRYFGAGQNNSTNPLIPLHNPFNGRIGELRIYSQALSAADVLFNFNASNYYPDGKNSCGVGPACRYYAM